MGLITPDYGLFFWSLVTFGLLLLVLRKFAWRPILQGIKNREELISKSLREAQSARNEIAKLNSQNVELIQRAQAERDAIMQEARTIRERMIQEASIAAQENAQAFMEQARQALAKEKEALMLEIKGYAGRIAMEIAERILREEFKDRDRQSRQIENILEQMTKQN